MSAGTPDPASAPGDERLLILAPTGRDADVLAAVAAAGGFATEILGGMAAVCDRIQGVAGALVLAEEAMSLPDAAALARALQAQAPWSDLPIVLLSTETTRDELRRCILGALEPSANLTILERPLHRETVTAAFAAALRARRRQYETRAALEQLDLERRRQDAVLAALPVGIMVTDASGRFLQINEAARRIWGGAPGAPLPADDGAYEAWWAGTDRRMEPHQWPLRVALAGGHDIADEELDIVGFDGARRTIISSAHPIRDAGGEVAGAVAVHVDITDHARAERAEQTLSTISAALSESLEPQVTLGALARIVAGRLADACVVDEVDDRGELHRLVAELSGDRPSGPIEPLLSRLSSTAGNDVGARVLGSRQPILMTVAGDAWAPARFEADERRDGAGTGSLLAVPLVARGRVLGVLGLVRLPPGRGYDARDVTLAEEIGRRAALALDNGRLHRQVQDALEMRAESLAELDAFLTSSPVGFAVFDRTLRFVRVNRVLAALHGLPADEHVGKTLGEVVQPAKAAQMATAIRRAMVTGEAVVDWTVTLKPPPGGGQTRHFLLSAVPLSGPSGKPRAAGVVLAEVTRIKEAEETLIRQATFRERYMGVLAHDLRTPLHAILLSARTLLLQPEAPAASLRAASRIERAASRMAKMVSDLLDLVRSREGGGIAVTPAPADLAEIAGAALRELEAAHPDRKILLSVLCDGRADLDKDRMAQVVSNLVGNALAYSPAGTPVEVQITGDADTVALAVHNLGAPIPAESMATLFEPFRRAHAEGSEEPAAQGLGLGLFIVHEVVQAHGGSVSATSSAVAGTTFTVRLPRRGAAEPARGR